jgi:hypothetical protein
MPKIVSSGRPMFQDPEVEGSSPGVAFTKLLTAIRSFIRQGRLI